MTREERMTDNEEDKVKAQTNDRSSGIMGGLILILLGILFLLATRHYIRWYDWWAYFLLGLGALFVLDFVVRSLIVHDRHTQTGKLVAGAVMMVIGASHIFGLASWWPLILVAVGVILLVTSFKKPAA
jgi:hypothetical protein